MNSIVMLLRVLWWAVSCPQEVLTSWLTLRKAARRARANGGNLRLLCREGGLGDVLWAAEAAKLCAAQHPADSVVFVTVPAMWEAAALVRDAAPRLVVHLPLALQVAVLRRFFAPPHLMRYDHLDHGGIHMLAAYLQDLGCTLPTTLSQPAWWYNASPAKPNTCAYIYAGPSWAVRELPAKTWETVVQTLQSEFGLRMYQVLPDAAAAPQIGGCDGIVAGEHLAELCTRFDAGTVVITIDSIMLHLAAGTQVPLVGLFGPTCVSARLFEAPHRRGLSAPVACAGCHHRQPRLHWETGCPHNIACMEQLDAAQIIGAVREVLSAPALTA